MITVSDAEGVIVNLDTTAEYVDTQKYTAPYADTENSTAGYVDTIKIAAAYADTQNSTAGYVDNTRRTIFVVYCAHKCFSQIDSPD